MPYKNKEDRIAFNKRYWKENKDKLSESNREWKINNKEKHRLARRKYLEDNRDLINNRTRLKYNNNEKVKYKKLIRCKTLRKYGKLKKGFIYHHNTDPYQEDSFDILESGIHDFLEKNNSRMIKNKKETGFYN